TGYVLDVFDYKGLTADNMVFYKDAQDATAHLNEIAIEAESLPGSCQMPLWDAMHAPFTRSMAYLKGAEVIIITAAAAPLDVDLASIQSTMELYDANAPIIDFIHIESVCQIEDWTLQLAPFYQFIQKTGGTMLRVEQDKISDVLTSFLPTRYAAQQLTVQDMDACQQSTMYIQVDSRMSEVYVMMGGSTVSISAIDPQGLSVACNTVYSSYEQKLCKIANPYPGIYEITVSSNSTFCYPSVYGYGGAQVFVGFIQDNATGDNPLPYAVYGKVNYPVFHVLDRPTDIYSPPPVETLYMAELMVSPSDKVYDMDLNRRADCSYEYIGMAFVCGQKDEKITIISSGFDDINQAFTRESVTWCKAG
ncbi:hypothetical protein PENTCL1PPCAC_7533, partial [Pristionchus entomophagus]